MKKLIALIGIFAATNAFASLKFYNTAGLDLGHVTETKCGSGLTCTKSAGLITMVASALSGDITLDNGEIISNTTDDTFTLKSDDSHTTVQALGFEAKDAILQLWADQGDDVADKFSIKSSTINQFSILNNATTLLMLESDGTQHLADSEIFRNASDVVSFEADDAAAHLKMLGFEANDAFITLAADESDDNGDDWKLSSVASSNSLIFYNDTSGAQVAKFTLTTAGALSLVGSVTGDGGDAMSGFLQAQVASTTAAITVAQCGSTFVSNSTDVMDLPEASTALGCRLTFVCGTADDFDINPADGTDQISVVNSVAGGTGAAIAPSAGDAIRCTDIGSSIVIEAVGADLWVTIGVGNGAWTDVN